MRSLKIHFHWSHDMKISFQVATYTLKYKMYMFPSKFLWKQYLICSSAISSKLQAELISSLTTFLVQVSLWPVYGQVNAYCPPNPESITRILVYLIAIIAFSETNQIGKSQQKKKTRKLKKMINFNVTDADRNEFGEKYIWQRVKSDIGLLHFSISIGVYSAFCNFLAQSGSKFRPQFLDQFVLLRFPDQNLAQIESKFKSVTRIFK